VAGGRGGGWVRRSASCRNQKGGTLKGTSKTSRNDFTAGAPGDEETAGAWSPAKGRRDRGKKKVVWVFDPNYLVTLEPRSPRVLETGGYPREKRDRGPVPVYGGTALKSSLRGFRELGTGGGG